MSPEICPLSSIPIGQQGNKTQINIKERLVIKAMKSFIRVDPVLYEASCRKGRR